jgi:hypothetical protein
VREIDDLCSFDKMKGDKNKHEDPTEWKNKQPGMYRKGNKNNNTECTERVKEK